MGFVGCDYIWGGDERNLASPVVVTPVIGSSTGAEAWFIPRKASKTWRASRRHEGDSEFLMGLKLK